MKNSRIEDQKVRKWRKKSLKKGIMERIAIDQDWGRTPFDLVDLAKESIRWMSPALIVPISVIQ